MKRMCIVCEGLTEAQFVKDCLAPYLHEKGILAFPSQLQARTGNHRGGRVTVDRLARQIGDEYSRFDRVTTLVDFYGFKDADGRNRAALEQAILNEVMRRRPNLDTRFILPYVQMYEFEGLLFSDIEQFQFVLDGWNAQTKEQLLLVAQAFASPEDINNSPETAPSKRILQIFSSGAYDKVEHGSIIASEIGIEKIRSVCAQFDQWLKRLEAWAHTA